MGEARRRKQAGSPEVGSKGKIPFGEPGDHPHLPGLSLEEVTRRLAPH